MIKNAFTDQSQVSIDEKTGSLKLAALDNLKSANEIYEQNLKTGETFVVAAKMLAKDPLTKEEKKLKKTAKKVLQFYTKESKQSSKESDVNLSNQLNDAGLAIKEKAHIFKENREEAEINSKIKVYAHGRVKELGHVKEDTELNFQNISDYGSAHTNNAADCLRHLMGGMVSIKDGNQEVFDVSEIPSDGKLKDKARVAVFKKRMEGVLYFFESKVTHGATEDQLLSLKKSVETLIDKISEAPDETHAQLELEETLLTWAKSTNPAEQNMCRLIHAMNQLYDIGKANGVTLLMQDTGADCPYQLLHLKGVKVEPDKSTKKINYVFTENAVTVTHRIHHKVTFPTVQTIAVKKEEDSIWIEQIMILTASLNDLKSWQSSSVILNLHTKGRATIATAGKLSRVFGLAGFETELNTTKFA